MVIVMKIQYVFVNLILQQMMGCSLLVYVLLKLIINILIILKAKILKEVNAIFLVVLKVKTKRYLVIEVFFIIDNDRRRVLINTPVAYPI